MKNDFSTVVTKGELKEELKTLEERVDENARSYRDDILNKLDQVMGELETMREENLIGSYHIKELRKTDANQERRIRKLEQTRNTS